MAARVSIGNKSNERKENKKKRRDSFGEASAEKRDSKERSRGCERLGRKSYNRERGSDGETEGRGRVEGKEIADRGEV